MFDAFEEVTITVETFDDVAREVDGSLLSDVSREAAIAAVAAAAGAVAGIAVGWFAKKLGAEPDGHGEAR